MTYPPDGHPFPAQRKVILPLRWIIVGVGTILAFVCVASSIAYIVIGVVAKIRGWM